MFCEKRKKLIDKIKKAIEEESLQNIEKDYITKEYRDQKNGIYFLYNNDDIVIYVGMVGNGSDTSFAHRMYLHGSGAHKEESWFEEAKKFRFKCFPELDKIQLQQLERLMIYAKHQPKYNDCFVTETDMDNILEKLL